MKYFLIISITFLTTFNNNFAQEGKVVYAFVEGPQKQIDSLKSNRAYLMLKSTMQQAAKNLQQIDFYLEFDPAFSLFSSQEGMKSDAQAFPISTYKTFFQLDGATYCNLKARFTLKKTTTFGQQYLIKDSLQKAGQDWEFSSEKKTILGFECFKARKLNNQEKGLSTFGGNIEVWYCPSLPAYTGPANYTGFPGMVLEVHVDSNFSYSLVAKEIIQTNVEIEEPTEGKLITQEQFLELGNSMRQRQKEYMNQN